MHHYFKFISLCSGTIHVSDGLSVHLQESKTVHAALGICQTDCLLAGTGWNSVHTASGICHTDSAGCLLAGTRWSSISFPLASSQQNLFDIYLMLYVRS